MSRVIKLSISILSILLITVTFAFVCQTKNTENAIEREQNIALMSAEAETVVIAAPRNSGIEHNEYRLIVSSDTFAGDMTFATQLSEHLRSFGTNIKYSVDIVVRESEFEVLLGHTNRALSSELYELCVNSTYKDELVWGYIYRDGKLAFNANSEEAFVRGSKEFIELYCIDGILAVPSDLVKISSLTRADYEEEVRIENERLEAEKEAQRLARIEELKQLIADFELADFGDVNMDTSMPQSPYAKPTFYPTAGEHPRLTVTSYMIPFINEFLESEEGEYLSRSFWSLANSSYTGILPAAKEVTSGRVGVHNVDEVGLMKIEAKALAYLLTGDEVYGYEAIYAIKNYLTTLDLQHIYSDQCREFGRTIMCAAEVYDWCYDLLGEADKEQLILGITDICDGQNAMGSQMEVGFPPYGQGSVSGHGSERQILRDYFSVAVAIYDEDPTWYETVAGRIYNEYVPFRNHYYQSGTYPQGINLYAPGRHNADTWSAWIMFTSAGETAYDPSLQNIVKSFYSYELPNGMFFGTGDSSRKSNSSSFNTSAYLMMALFGDDYLYSWIYRNTVALRGITASNLEMSYSHIAILLSVYFSDSQKSFEPISTYENVSTVSYNGYPIGQMISRYEWQNTNAPAVFMKIGERTTANHEHGDAGTFQIYFKGLYTGESGAYDKYGSTHFKYYHQATVAHNGLLVYNDTKYDPTTDADGNAVNAARYWYSGSQRDPGEAGSLWDWLEISDYDTGEVTGHEYAINKDGTTDYAYLSGDITAAYASETVDYVGRRMLSVYTGNPDFPLYFIVYDKITSDSENYEKRFLLQTPTEPIIDEAAKTVTIIDAEGKLVLTSLKGGDSLNKLGGVDQTYLINGVNCETLSGSDGNNWGRVEICAAIGEKTTDMLNVMYVTDATNENIITPTVIENEKLIGTRIENTVVIFSKELDPTCEGFEFTTEGTGLVRHFISGVHAGTWHVKVDGVSVATVTASDEGHLISFYAPCGAVSITPGSDVPPANGGRIIYNAFGGIVPDDAPLTFEVGVPVRLPENVTRGSDIFLGWYSHESLADEYLITELVATEKGRFNVYAKYKAFPLSETFETTGISHTESNQMVNGVTYSGSGKTGSAFETITENENTYLKVTKGTKDPAINFSEDIPNYIGSDTVLTVCVDLAKDGDNPLFASNCRLRASSTKDVVSIFTVSSDGSVLLTGKTKVMTLTDTFQSLCISIDFEAGTMTAYEKYGKVLATTTFAPPSVSGLTSTLDWMHTLTTTFNWYMASGSDGTMLVDNMFVYAGEFEPEVEVIPDGMGKIIYNTGGVALPDNTPNYYEMGKTTPLPSLTSDIDEFVGWYTTPTFDEGTLVTAIPEDAVGEFSVYARWRGIYMKEDFENVEDTSYVEEGGSFGSIGFNTSAAKIGSAARTETDENGNTYLVFIRGENDPFLYSSGGVGAFASTNNAITVQVSMGLVENMSAASITYRLRAKIDGKNTHLNVFSVTSSGAVLLGGYADYVLTTLTEEFQTIAVTVNWDTSKLIGYVDGMKICEIDVDLSYYNLEWLTLVTTRMNFYSSKSGEALKFDNFLAYTDVYPDKGLTAPEGKGNIIYETGGGTLADGAPIYFDKTAETPLPEIYKTGDEFLGWYTDPAFTEESKITSIPPTDSDSFTVYARWKGIFINQNFDQVEDAEYIEEKGSIGGISFNPKTGASFKTQTDEQGNKYVILAISSETAVDPHLSYSGSIPAFSGNTNAITVEASVSLVDGANALSCSYRLRSRINNQKLDLYLFSINNDGEVLLGGSSEAVLCTLDSASFTDIAVTVNWDTGYLVGYVNGVEAGTLAFDTETRGLDWLAGVSNTMYFYAKDTDGAVKIDNLFAYSDVYSGI